MATQAKKMKAIQSKQPGTPYTGGTGYIVALGAAVLAFAGAAFLVYDRPVAGWEHTWFTAVNDWPASWKYAFLAITLLGSTWLAAAAVIAAYAFKLYWLTWRLAVSIIIGYGAALGLKAGFDRPRPEDLFDTAHIRAVESSAGFPSAHVMIITIVMLSLLPYLPKGWRWLIALPPIAAVALSRMYLGVHLPLDVLGGVALGLLVVCSVRLLPRPVRRTLRLG
jgi:undecaprenyl-diphosphatase